MLKIKNDDTEYVVEQNREGQWLMNDAVFEADIRAIRPGHYHVIRNNQSFRVEVLQVNTEEKVVELKVNGNLHTLSVKDRYDDLLEQMGMDNLNSARVADIKAPMPGLVLDIVVEEGAEVAKGDPVIVLEAMKMENILKSPADGVVKQIKVAKGAAVEKNEVILNFE